MLTPAFKVILINILYTIIKLNLNNRNCDNNDFTDLLYNLSLVTVTRKNNNKVIKRKFLHKKRKLLQKPNIIASHAHPLNIGEIDVFLWSEDIFIENFRISIRTFKKICENIRHCIEKKINFGKTTIPVEKRLAICIYFLKSGADYSHVANNFKVSKTVVFNVVSDVCNGIIQTYYRSKIKFPRTETERKLLADGFLEITQFPGCLGIIDGLHIPAQTIDFANKDYNNSKGWYSTILLAVTDFKYRFTYIYIGSPGKDHVGKVFENCALKRRINEGLIPIDYHILGNNTFPLSNSLLIPFRDVNLNEDKKHFNKYLNSARIVVENGFGRLRGRWRILLNESCISDFHKIITTCCILHNICEDENEFYNPQWTEAVDEFEASFEQPENIAYPFNIITSEGISKRDSILSIFSFI